MTEVGERMAKIEEKVDGLKENIDDIKTTLNSFIASADERYAPKWVADALKWAIGIVVGTVILAVLSLVIFK